MSKIIIPFDALRPLVALPLREISELTGHPVTVVRNSLIHHKLWNRGKIIQKFCSNCNSEFWVLPSYSNQLFCSDECKLKHPWNEGLTSNDHDSIQASHRWKEWVLQAQHMPGVIDITRIDWPIPYIDHHGKDRSYYPDFMVRFETGLVWVVEIKVIYTELDLHKISSAVEWCEKQGYLYRLITKGLIHKNTWQSIVAHPKHFILPSKEYIMMNHAASWARLSPSPDLQVGCIISSLDFKHVLAYGYNGDESGGSNLPQSYTRGEDGFLHAEENAISKLDSKEDASLFCTDSPCEMCAKRIINCGSIKKVYYLRTYRNLTGIGLLIKRGIPVYKFELIDQRGQPYSEQDAFESISPRGPWTK